MEPPSEVSINDAANMAVGAQQRVFSLQREKELAESLAFLASWSDDPRHIVAVCTEEKSGGTGILIRVAVNRGSLGKVEPAFQNMASTLENVSRKGLAWFCIKKQVNADVARL